VSPRPYRLGRREASVEATRGRILAAARTVLAAEAEVASFTVDTVAEQAGVARMTVYYQFESKRGLLEALFDTLAMRGLVGPLRDAFARPDPVEALEAFVAAFCGFWASDRVVIRRLRSLAGLDRDIGRSIHARDLRRLDGLRAICQRLTKAGRTPTTRVEQLDILNALTSFEVFDMLAGATRGEKDVARLVTRLVRAELALSAARRQRKRAPARIARLE
jgi:AcrR family transcriptional regulator